MIPQDEYNKLVRKAVIHDKHPSAGELMEKYGLDLQSAGDLRDKIYNNSNPTDPKVIKARFSYLITLASFILIFVGILWFILSNLLKSSY